MALHCPPPVCQVGHTKLCHTGVVDVILHVGHTLQSYKTGTVHPAAAIQGFWHPSTWRSFVDFCLHIVTLLPGITSLQSKGRNDADDAETTSSGADPPRSARATIANIAVIRRKSSRPAGLEGSSALLVFLLLGGTSSSEYERNNSGIKAY